jgi:hypothetical protein
MNLENRMTVKDFVLNRLRSVVAGTFKAIKQYDQEARQIPWTTFSNLNTWFDSFEKYCIELGFAQREANGSIGFIHPERIFNLDETNVVLRRPSMTHTCPALRMRRARYPNSVLSSPVQTPLANPCHLTFNSTQLPRYRSASRSGWTCLNTFQRSMLTMVTDKKRV